MLWAASPALAGPAPDGELSVSPAGVGARPRWPAHRSAEAQYERGVTEKNVAIGLTATGSVFLAGGAFLGLASLQAMGRTPDPQGGNYLPIAYGFFAIAAGLVSVPLLATGIPLWRRGNARMLQARPYLEVSARSWETPRRVGMVVSGRF